MTNEREFDSQVELTQKNCPRPNSLSTGIVCGMLSAVAYTGANIALKNIVNPPDDSWTRTEWAVWISCLKAAPAALTAWLIIGYRFSRRLPALPAFRLSIILFVTGLAMQFGGNVAFQWALSICGLALTIPVIFAAIITSSAILAKFYLHESITRRSMLAIATMIFAIAVLHVGATATTQTVDEMPGSMPESSMPVLWGIAAACVSGVAYGVSGVVIRHAVQTKISLSATLVFLSTSGVVGLGLTSWVRMGPDQLIATPVGTLGMMLVAGIFNAIAFFSLGAALRHITILHVNLLNASQIAMCAIAGVLWFDERMTLSLFVGIGLTLTGLFLLEKQRTHQDGANNLSSQ